MVESGVSPLPRGARPYQGRRAGLVSRLVAAGIDALVVVLSFLVGSLGIAVFLFLFDPRSFTVPALGPVAGLTWGFLVLVVYETLAWCLTGRTYGGRVLGLRIVGPTGRRLGITAAFARALLTACFPIGILWVAVSRENRSVQDVVLRTSVIYDWQSQGELRLPRSDAERAPDSA
ncbi:RDD family protein [Nocardioides pacificus]